MFGHSTRPVQPLLCSRKTDVAVIREQPAEISHASSVAMYHGYSPHCRHVAAFECAGDATAELDPLRWAAIVQGGRLAVTRRGVQLCLRQLPLDTPAVKRRSAVTMLAGSSKLPAYYLSGRMLPRAVPVARYFQCFWHMQQRILVHVHCLQLLLQLLACIHSTNALTWRASPVHRAMSTVCCPSAARQGFCWGRLKPASPRDGCHLRARPRFVPAPRARTAPCRRR